MFIKRDDFEAPPLLNQLSAVCPALPQWTAGDDERRPTSLIMSTSRCCGVWGVLLFDNNHSGNSRYECKTLHTPEFFKKFRMLLWNSVPTSDSEKIWRKREDISFKIGSKGALLDGSNFAEA
jgi:hypothetical protein